MWKAIIALGVLLLFHQPELQAARCKVDGEWYSYDSPQCNPNKQVGQKDESIPENPVSDSLPEPQPASEAPIRSPITGPALMASYLRPWSEVAYLAEEHCRDPKPQFGGPECLIWEERGYWAMHGNFAMPEHIAPQSKAICTAKSSSFRSQALCMHNESMGYRKFMADSEMPEAKAQAARKECEQQLSSWSQRGSCVSSAIYRFKYPNGAKRTSMGVSRGIAGNHIDAPPGYAKESEVVTFRVRPRDDRRSQVSGGEPPMPQPLDIRKRAARLAPDAADPDVLAEAIRTLETNAVYHVLSAGLPQVEGVATTAYSWPATVHSRFGVRFTEQDNSALGMSLEVEAGRVYLLDYVVWASEPGSYVVTSRPDQHIFEDVGAAIRHVTVRLLAEKTGAIGLSLKHQYGKGFTFHAVAVTSIEATGVFAPENGAPVSGLLPEEIDNS